MTTRRVFLGTLAGGLLATTLTAESQEAAKVARIGYLASSLTSGPHVTEAFRQGLRDLGYVEGRTIASGRSGEARLTGFDFIEGWYNPRRRHSALDYRSPLIFERS